MNERNDPSETAGEESRSPVAEILELRGVTWEWRDMAPDEAKEFPGLGIIAQDVERIYPQLVETDEDRAPREAPPGYHWVTPGQLTSLVRHGHYVNVQARTLLACLYASGARTT